VDVRASAETGNKGHGGEIETFQCKQQLFADKAYVFRSAPRLNAKYRISWTYEATKEEGIYT
jgi:hypothetical protein